MKKFAAIAVALPICLLAADFWQSKPFTEWNTREAQRVLDDSPWARPFYIPVESARQGGKKQRAGMGELDAPVSSGKGGAVEPMEAEAGPAHQLLLTVRWQSAGAVKEAVLRLKYGAEAATSAEARTILETEAPDYVIAVQGLTPGMLGHDMEALKESLMEQSSLRSKGKPATKATGIEFHNGAHSIDAYFVFPRTPAFALEDKDVEFVARFPMFQVTQKFRLKDMMLNGKLAL
jgi:hypothetical protein